MRRKQLDRLLIVGRGSIGTRHLRLARALFPTATIAVLSRTKKGLPSGADAAFTSLKEALAFAPQAAVIANPATLHVETALPLAKRGVHLLMEKPIAARAIPAAKQLVEVCAAKKLALLIGYDLRFDPALQFFRTAVKKSVVGRIVSVRAVVGQNLEGWRAIDYRQSVSAHEHLGGGVLLELSHEIDYLRWIFGEIDWVSATARRQSDLEIDTEDTVHMAMGFAPVRGRQLVASLDMDFVRHDTLRRCEAIGSEGTLRWDALKGKVEVHGRKDKTWRTLFAKKSKADRLYIAEWNHFLDCIAGKAALISGKDGLATLKVVDAAKKSSRTGKVVHVR